MYKKRMFYQIALKICPFIALLFSILVTVITFYINQGLSSLFIFISIQVYLNWYSIYSISCNATTLKRMNREPKNDSVILTINSESQSPHKFKYWYCEKCLNYTYRPTQHCIGCNKCFHFRDHHCFFIGACIIQQNMGNFIVICFHASLACFYSLSILGPYLYANLEETFIKDPSVFNIIISFCFPIALARYISGKTSCLLLVTLFDALWSVGLLCFAYSIWKLYSCLTGKQKYYGEISRKQELKEVFGSYRLCNFLFPYNGLAGTRDVNGKYQLKEV
ncbi:palmitoyltransferase ZDHHC22-like [Chelonus insularis]|uniref:palmitoyltransferase ZDHHC22-like n=1 Tax=Chelonus insularis TaxID=460826 RepID=UPI00158E5D70|nr:palmitoyltransferase ZDHHC22-like [Chelonus insularis]